MENVNYKKLPTLKVNYVREEEVEVVADEQITEYVDALDLIQLKSSPLTISHATDEINNKIYFFDNDLGTWEERGNDLASMNFDYTGRQSLATTQSIIDYINNDALTFENYLSKYDTRDDRPYYYTRYYVNFNNSQQMQIKNSIFYENNKIYFMGNEKVTATQYQNDTQEHNDITENYFNDYFNEIQSFYYYDITLGAMSKHNINLNGLESVLSENLSKNGGVRYLSAQFLKIFKNENRYDLFIQVRRIYDDVGSEVVWCYLSSTDFINFNLISTLKHEDASVIERYTPLEILDFGDFFHILSSATNYVSDYRLDVSDGQFYLTDRKADLRGYQMKASDIIYINKNTNDYYLIYPNSPAYIYKRNYYTVNEGIVDYFNSTVSFYYEKTFPFNYSDDNGKTVISFATYYNGSYYKGDLKSIVQYETIETKTDLVEFTTQGSISFGEGQLNPSFESQLFNLPLEDYIDNNREAEDVLLSNGRKVEVLLAVEGQPIVKIFDGRTRYKGVDYLQPAELKAFGEMKILKEDVKPFNLGDMYIKDVIQNILLRKNGITVDRYIVENVPSLMHPAQTYDKDEIVNIITNVLQDYPEIIFFTTLDGKFKLKGRSSTAKYNFTSSQITALRQEEDGNTVNHITVRGVSFTNTAPIEVLVKDDLSVRQNGKESLEFTTSIYKTRTEMEGYANRLLKFYKSGYKKMTLEFDGIYLLEPFDTITATNDRYNINNTNKWTVLDVTHNVFTMKTNATVETYIPG